MIDARSRRGSTLMLFVVMAFPFMFVGGMFAVDATRLYLATSEARNVADAAARAGASQVAPGTTTLDEAAAAAAADEMVLDAERLGVFVANDMRCAGCDPYDIEVSTLDNTVTVTIAVHVPDLTFAGLLLSRNMDFTARTTSVAQVCIPGDPASSPGSFCTRPSG